MSEEIKNNIEESEVSAVQPEENNTATENKIFSIFTNLMLRLTMVGLGVMIFAMAFLRATNISGFDTTKLLLFEICLLVLFVFIIGISVALVMMRHDCKAKNTIAVIIYVSALSVMVLLPLVWVFFKATPV